MSKVNVTPKAGIIVRKPDGSILSPKGEVIKRNAYWVRRINDGDVVIIKSDEKSTDAAKEKK